MSQSKRILVIDDDTAILEAFELMLRFAGYEVDVSTKNGPVVFKKIRQKPPDLIILDILLSGSDGRTIAKHLKAEVTTKHIPIIMVSAHPNMAKSALESGADEFISKPFEIDDILERVEKYLN
jgi:DNA-binding response OmpR family regulator